tara:strand:- start:2194 stop:2790 length:597 start_codon:yes stop_codon:yes gene_type:complete
MDLCELTTKLPVKVEVLKLLTGTLWAIVLAATIPSKMIAAEEAFPPTEPGEIEIKTIPAGRLLESSGDGDYFRNSGRLFSLLFRYIQQNGISMTTPVEAQINPGKMYFWVAEDQIGKATSDSADVKVIDAPSRRVVSIGARGSYTQANYKKAKEALLEWIEKEELVIEGELYAVYWDGPFTPWFLKTFEVQAQLNASE